MQETGFHYQVDWTSYALSSFMELTNGHMYWPLGLTNDLIHATV